MFNRILFIAFFLLINIALIGQTKVVGYAFETGNRGFIKNVMVTLSDESSKEVLTGTTDINGEYQFEINPEHSYKVKLEHDLFLSDEIKFNKDQITENETVFLSHELKREPGYIFEITLAEKNRNPDTPKNQTKGALVEVFNNTTEEVVLVIDSLTLPDFKIDLKKGNHYTVLVRHPEYLTKRMEAFVDVEGCILCFEGIGDVRPGVSDNLTEGNTQGTLLANVELERYFDGKIISLSNIYYDYNDHKITSKAAKELDKAAVFINDNPDISIELSSHTDSRGEDDYNMQLSQRRSESAVRYLLEKGKVNPNQITAQGYGETRLKNECEDGATCSEEEHSFNRRTELELLELETVKEIKSLADMKREEKFERMLRELEFGSSQVRVKTTADRPPHSSKSSNNTQNFEAVKSNGAKIIEEKTEKIVKATSHEAKTTETTESLGETVLSGIDNYTGYKFVIHFSRFTLPDSHDLFSKHSDIFDFVTKDNNHLYMIGDFMDRDKAFEKLNSDILKAYPNAYLVGFKNGIRIE